MTIRSTLAVEKQVAYFESPHLADYGDVMGTDITPERLEAAGWKIVPAHPGFPMTAEIYCGYNRLAYFSPGGDAANVIVEHAMFDSANKCLLGKARTMEQLTAVVDAIRGLYEGSAA